jgi:hypothetical protein
MELMSAKRLDTPVVENNVVLGVISIGCSEVHHRNTKNNSAFGFLYQDKSIIIWNYQSK